tara:strand:- start:279 stop:389 length:111 start_codon:yes stop_codon:yes gene_type:complete
MQVLIHVGLSLHNFDKDRLNLLKETVVVFDFYQGLG